MRFYSNGNWSVGPVGAILLAMLWLAMWPVWIVVGTYKIDARLGHVAVGAPQHLQRGQLWGRAPRSVIPDGRAAGPNRGDLPTVVEPNRDRDGHSCPVLEGPRNRIGDAVRWL
jgi:hypothetical protein